LYSTFSLLAAKAGAVVANPKITVKVTAERIKLLLGIRCLLRRGTAFRQQINLVTGKRPWPPQVQSALV
jgi:hypothetical protein